MQQPGDPRRDQPEGQGNPRRTPKAYLPGPIVGDELGDGEELPLFLLIPFVIIFTLIVDAMGVAFLFKVWNERQMTYAYQEQAIQQARIADALERLKTR